MKPGPTLAFAELAKRGDHAGRLALPAICPALWPSAAFVGFQGLANGYELVLVGGAVWAAYQAVSAGDEQGMKLVSLGPCLCTASGIQKRIPATAQEFVT